MTRVLHILSQRPGRSGSGVFLAAMVREAGRRGYEQHAIVAGPPGTSAAELPPLRDDQLSTIVFPSDDAPFPVPGNSDVMPYPTTVFSRMSEREVEQYLAASRRVMERVRDAFRPDVVHSHHLWLMTALAREVFADIPMIATSHNAELRQMIKAPHLAPRVKPGVKKIDKVCVLTPQSIDDTVDVFNVDKSRIALTGAGYDAELFRSAVATATALRSGSQSGGSRHRTPKITFVGRLSTPKGVPFLLQATKEHLTLVGASGSGADGQHVDDLVRAAGDRVTHTGAKQPAEVADILRDTSVFVLPSLFEGLPLTMLEALACGCRVVVSALPTIRSWVPRAWIDKGWIELVPPLETTRADEPVAADVPRYVRDLGDAIHRQLARPAARDEIAGAMPAHSWSAVFDRYERVYAEVR